MVDKMVSREVARSDPQKASLSADVKALSLVDWWAEVAFKTQKNKIQIKFSIYQILDEILRMICWVRNWLFAWLWGRHSTWNYIRLKTWNVRRATPRLLGRFS